MHWYFDVLKNYVGFKGRAHRQEFWMFTSIHVLIFFALWFVDAGLLWAGSPVIGLGALYAVGTCLPQLSVRVRRLHDTNRTGWWILLLWIPQALVGFSWVMLLPDSDGSRVGPRRSFELGLILGIVGTIAFLVLMCLEGTNGKNRFGPDPRGFQGEDVGDDVCSDIA